MATAANPNQFILLDSSLPQALNQPAFGFTIGTNPPAGVCPISSFILFIILAASGVAAIARVLYALGLKTANSNNEAKLTEANKIITTTLGSLLMLFSLTLLLLKVNPDMVTGNVDFSKVVVKNNIGPTPQQAGTTAPKISTNIAGNELAVRNQFNAVGITINKEPCATPSSTNCTDVGGLKSNTIDTILQLRQACGCTFMITGGSEAGGHGATSNHPKGTAVDISQNAQLKAFFTDSKITSNTLCGPKYSFGGLIFWDEGPGCEGNTTVRHYHASITGN